MALDILIKGGTIIDGSGRPRYRGDVGISGDRVTAVGVVDEPAARVIDADGRFVTPGFIDGHTHLDAQLFWDPLGTSPAWHGVTSAVMGNCGFTLAPGRASGADLVIRSIERAEDMSRRAIELGVDWTWESYPDYLDAVERLHKGINIAGYVGHSAIRTYVMGERAYSEEASESDVERMRDAVRASISAGAIGFSTSRSPAHTTYGDDPVASRVASWSEVEALVDVMRELGTGIFQLALESRNSEDRLDFLSRLSDLAIASGRLTTFFVRDDKDLATLADTNRRGGRAVGQMNIKSVESVMNFQTVTPFDQLPAWKEFSALPLAEKRHRLSDVGARQRLVDAAINGHYITPVNAEPRPPDYESMIVLTSIEGSNESVATVAARRGVHPVELMVDLALETDFEQFFVQPITTQPEDKTYEELSDPNTVIAGSDAGAHLSQIMDSAIPTMLLSQWVRDRQRLTFEEAVRKLTSDIAQTWGLQNRGRIEEGFQADVVVFDPETIAPCLPKLQWDLPDGGPRLVQRAVGIDTVLVNGQISFEHGESTGARAGRLLRGGSVGKA
jgi:N-acyl-D-amino-acid deacylase